MIEKKINNVDTFLPTFFYINTDSDLKKEYYRLPFGQAIWTLFTSDDLISHYIKLWFTLNINIKIRTSPHYFIYCPLHSETIYRTPKKENEVICPKCKTIYHLKCNFWHFIDEECPQLKENQRRCPNCLTIVEKISGCNHIQCQCQKHWCFQCKNSPIFDSPSQCYLHMKTEHDDPYYFTIKAFHIYLNQQNKIINLEKEKLYFEEYISSDVVLVIHDHQDGNKLQIYSYDYENFNNKYKHSLPLEIEKIYDYDSVFLLENKSLFNNDDLKTLFSTTFDYST